MKHIFDSHAHYDDTRFDDDRHDLLTSLPGKGVRYVLNAASDLDSSETSIALARAYPFVYCAVGVHPHAAKDATADMEERLTALAKQPKVRALGEMGLDYHYDFSEKKQQLDVFRRQLALARVLSLPVIVHDREAHADTLALLREYRPTGVVHCFSGSAEMARELVGLGLYLGFTGVVTFKNARRALEAAQAVPLERLLVETDCPYMAPEPYRGQRCDSSMLVETAGALAALHRIDTQTLLERTCQNAQRLYGIID